MADLTSSMARQVLGAAAAGVSDVVRLLPSDAGDPVWRRPTPCADWDLRTLLNHLTAEQLALRVRAVGKIGGFASAGARKRNGAALEPIGQTRIRFADGWVEMPRYRRDDLRAGDRLTGPLVIEELSSRIVIDPGDAIEVRDDAAIAVSVASVARD